MSVLGSDDNNGGNPAPNLLNSDHVIITGLSGNELYCMALTGYVPGNILVGNSVYAIGVLGNMAAAVHSTIGGEIPQYSNMISEGRRLALDHLEAEMSEAKADGATGVTNEIIFHPQHIEFLSVGTSLYKSAGEPATNFMTSSTNAQELFCELDAGFQPVRMAFGNVSYSIGVGGNILGSLRKMAHGEVRSYSDIFTTTRYHALKRLCEHASAFKANCTTNIRTTVLPIGNKGLQEMVMIGTASYHPLLSELADRMGTPLSSGLTGQELWSVVKLGYAPLKVVMGTSVYSLGVVGGLRAALRSIAKGQVGSLTQMIYGAREQSLKKIQDQAEECGADMVVGAKSFIYELGNGLVEFLAIGTAVKRVDGLSTRSAQLPAQAIISETDTFIDNTQQVIPFGSHPAMHTHGVSRDELNQSI